ncbi:MAG: ph-response sensor protein [Geoglossum simile]|nr:MAG: ph-response sensor protein [Geoglossum simile]
MAQDNSTSAKPPRSLPTRCSIFARLTSPLSSRTRTLSEFYVKPDEPHRQYHPGDSVKGSVNLTVLRLTRITHLVVRLHGFIRVSKNGNPPGEGVGDSQGAGLNKRSVETLANGYMPIFDDEVVLCGEGKLDPGMYNFKFILEFPKQGLPSSIDFERGTISYMITSTLTRPTTISPMTRCDLKIRLIESIDIAPITPPPSRVVTLEPISRRPRGKGSKGRETNHRGKRKASHDGHTPSPEGSEPSSLRDSGDQPVSPRSPAPSEDSGESAVSSSTGSLSFRLASASKTPKKSNPPGSVLSLADKTITATVDLLRGGCLRGDTVPVRVSINHTKRIKSLHGIIITLYRQGRIDSHPLIPLPSTKSKEAEKAKHEDYYPRTRTGLGSLSLSSAGSSSVYRKDLAQTFAPLIIDPQTLSTVVMASVRVPEDAFPTIASVPGGMIAFKYYIEVVIDLGGKLAGQDRVLPRIGLVNMYGVEEGSTNMLAAWGGGVVETDHIRREKSVVDVQFEIIVGTKDSARGRGKRVENQRQVQESENHGFDTMLGPDFPYTLGNLQQQYDTNGHGGHASWYAAGQVELHRQRYSYHEPPMPIDVPQPEIAESEEVDEKARLQIAEERLLPSAPPEGERGSPPVPTIREPSAPVIPGGAELNHYQFHVESVWAAPPHHLYMSHLQPLAPQTETRESSSNGNYHPGDILRPDEVSSHTNEHPPTEDKRDLERRRLQAEASAPEDFARDDDEAVQSSGVVAASEGANPTAPALTEEDEYGYLRPFGSENLPQYER